ncbi:zinc finger protein 654 [Gastrophryne carolinensis]
MAEDESDQESERLVEELEAIIDEELRGLEVAQHRSLLYCRRFCEVVEDYTSRWHVPLPQLQVLQTALCCFTSASVSFPDECEHVQYVLSRLALSLFELLLFFGKDEFYEAPLKDILGSVQECHELLFRYDNTDLRLVTCVIKDGGPWEDPVLQAILKGKSEPQDIVDKYLSSENQLFFEFRVRYLIACERISEAVALITTCLSHPEVGKNHYYHQAYFICLYMTKLTDKLLPEHVLRVDPSDGVKIVCNIEKEGKTALAMQLSEAFLLKQLQSGNMESVWDLIFIWSKLQLKVNSAKEVFVEQCYKMLRIAANVKVIFPFMKAIRDEIGEAAVQLSVELCGCALQLDLSEHPDTQSLIYKTLAYLLPKDLEICRICALSVFFLERTVESYRVVERLYKYSDEDYNEFNSYVENRVRFELLPILKRGLLFDPEFWSLPMIQQNCVELLGIDAASVLSTPEPPENVVEESLPVVEPVLNGLLKHKETSSRLRLTVNSRKSHVVQTPYKMEHYVPRHPCILCHKEFLGGHILRHAQTHNEGGCFTCVLCARKFRNKLVMLRHLKHHLKKMQRCPMADPSGAACENKINEAISSEESSSTLDSGISNNSSSEGLSTVSNQELSKGYLIPGENDPPGHNEEYLNHLMANQTIIPTEASNMGDMAIALVATDAGEEKSDCVKLNGAILDKDDPTVDSQVSFKCPAQGCSRVFQHVRAMNKHARKAHPSDVKVLQHIMSFNKGKCRFCKRKFASGRHFMDHLKRHFYPNVYYCPQQNCNNRFKSASELAEHQSSHDSFRVQCGFMNCPEVFDHISSLHTHEAQHYEQNAGEDFSLPTEEPLRKVPKKRVRQKEVLDQPPPVFIKKAQAVETPVVELPVPTWKSRKDVAQPKTYKQTEKKINGDVQTAEQILQTCSETLETDTGQDTAPVVQPAIVEEQVQQEQTVTEADMAIPKASTPEPDPDHTPPSIMVEETEEKTGPNAANAPKSNHPAGTVFYRSASTRFFSRPQPPSYLDEQYLTMPKRRHQDQSTEIQPVRNTPEEKLRCAKCLKNYCSSEALEEHQAQKKCQLYFGFDSDDESK